ncbi:MAG: hypothetical protein OHK0046_47250 [Anaerolineae bacterium]
MTELTPQEQAQQIAAALQPNEKEKRHLLAYWAKRQAVRPTYGVIALRATQAFGKCLNRAGLQVDDVQVTAWAMDNLCERLWSELEYPAQRELLIAAKK